MSIETSFKIKNHIFTYFASGSTNVKAPYFACGLSQYSLFLPPLKFVTAESPAEKSCPLRQRHLSATTFLVPPNTMPPPPNTSELLRTERSNSNINISAITALLDHNLTLRRREIESRIESCPTFSNLPNANLSLLLVVASPVEPHHTIHRCSSAPHRHRRSG